MFGTQNYGGGFTQQGGASYRPQQAQQQSAESLSLDDVMQGGAPSAFSKDDPIGTSVEGEIVEIRAEQQTDFTTGEPLYYPNGKPKPQVVIHLQTTLQDPNRVGDSGIRGVYVKGYNIGQLRLACRQAGVGDHPNVGDHLKATFARTQPAKTRGYNDAKIYDYIVTPCSSCTVAIREFWAQFSDNLPPRYRDAINALAPKAIDINALLVDVLHVSPKTQAKGQTKVTYHESCHLQKSLGVSKQPRDLIRMNPGYNLVEMAEANRCCGCGGSFTLTHYDISQQIGQKKRDSIVPQGPTSSPRGCPACMMQLSDMLHGTATAHGSGTPSSCTPTHCNHCLPLPAEGALRERTGAPFFAADDISGVWLRTPANASPLHTARYGLIRQYGSRLVPAAFRSTWIVRGCAGWDCLSSRRRASCVREAGCRRRPCGGA